MTRADSKSVDVAVIGAGPIGIELAAGLKHARVDYVQVEAGAIGSTLLWWAPCTRFFSSPERIELCGIPLQSIDQEKTTREHYLAYLRAVVAQLDLSIQTFTRVDRIEQDGSGFIIRAARGDGSGARLLTAKRLVLAIGNMHQPRMLGISGEELPHVSHYLGEPHRHFRRRVLIVGGRNSAVEAAIRLHRSGARVAICYRKAGFDTKRVKYWLRPELEWLISKGRIEFHPETLVERIDQGTVTLRSAARDGHRRVIDADDVLLLTGYEMDCALLRDLGAELIGDEQAPAFDPGTMETSVPGVFVAGTAASGSAKRATLFIENSHIHAARIVRAIAGVELPWKTGDEYSALAES